MLKKIMYVACMIVAVLSAAGCGTSKGEVKIGVSFGVGGAARWPQEQQYMEARAKELGAEIEVRLNQTDEPKTQTQDCFEMIDSGIDVLILTPRDVKNVKEIVEYASKKKVKVINYARVSLGEKMDLFVGYDSGRIGQTMGQYLSEKVYEGDYILLRGDPGDNNATLLYEGAMRYIDPLGDKINIILDGPVPGWSADEAKQMVLEAVKKNGNKVDAILAPNDKLAGACIEALQELGVTEHVAISGMDAELDAVKRVAEGTQDLTIYMDLEELSRIAIDEAYHMATGQKVNVNTKFDNGVSGGVDANLITGHMVIQQNLDKVLIDSGYFTKEEVYGTK